MASARRRGFWQPDAKLRHALPRLVAACAATAIALVAAQWLVSPLLASTLGWHRLAGLAIVLHHNIWVADWRVLITFIGWAGTIGGAIRIAIPQHTIEFGRTMLTNPYTLPVMMGFYLVIGALLSYFGYRPQ